jgi:hypothetical protein
MPHVLFVTEKWCDGDPIGGSTNSEHNLFGSLEASGLATFERFHFDEYYRSRGDKADGALLTRLQSGTPRPDLVMATPLCGSEMTPEYETYAQISRMGIPLVFICFDSIDDYTREGFLKLAPVSTATIVLDQSVHELFRDPRFIPLWTPQDPRIFHNAHGERTIDVSFAGSIGRYPDRQRALARLREAAINVFQAGGQREHSLSVYDYAAVHQRSRIALNFAKAGWEGGAQVKGRVFEATLCGALLLEEDNIHIKRWFEPGREYVPFFDSDDLVEKTQFYLRHEEERERIARRGWEKARRYCNERRFWGRMLELAGVGWRAWWPVRQVRRVRDQPLRRLPGRLWRRAWSTVERVGA